MIKPTRAQVSRITGRAGPGALWLYFDSSDLVELTPELARDLTYQLGDELGLFVCPRDAVGEVDQ
ncbi:hypothetical protein ABZ921_19350 [Streptomyces atriruber]|uniref:Uncharacterized protein n=1 Tax=Streptomyces atriruber TaxID=545121 RepID=A0ABV3BP50_9ACTN